MGNGVKITIIIAALMTMIFAIKPYYGGEVTIRLNEPPNFVYTPSDYSNLVFYSLLYENLFYLGYNGGVVSNIFEFFRYDNTSRTLVMELKKNLSFSNGEPIQAESVKFSLRRFLDKKLENSLKLGGLIKNISTDGNRVVLELIYDTPGVTGMLTAPELVLLSGTDGVFSGMFFPVEWEKGRYIKLAPNKYYPGGRTYLDGVKVVFYDFHYPDIFLSRPGLSDNGFQELTAGIYQNIYLGFPSGKVSTNKRLAVYSLLRAFGESIGMTPLNALTSDGESPVTLNIKQFAGWKYRSILRHSAMKLYILSSLKEFEEQLAEFLSSSRLRRIETVYLSDNELANFMGSTQVDYLLMVKVFNKRMPLEEKIKKIIKEMSFTRFNETYLKMLNELEEVTYLKDEEMLIDQVSRLIEKIVNDGFLLPLFQKRYSLYVGNDIEGIVLDNYGRPLFRKMRIKAGSQRTVHAVETNTGEGAMTVHSETIEPGGPNDGSR
jgi:hypothetical protein